MSTYSCQLVPNFSWTMLEHVMSKNVILLFWKTSPSTH